MLTSARSKFAGLLAAHVIVAAFAPAVALADDDPWPSLRKDMFGARDIAEGGGAIFLDAPVRAEDAALVPITIRIPASHAGAAKAVTLVVDKNPSPLVAAFEFGPAAGGGERLLSTRVRIDMYSNVRAILETTDGALHMTAAYVKAAGGCSAPALKDTDAALAQVGETRVKTFASEPGKLPEAQVMVRHPNYSGMQMNQLTGLYIPAKFVEEMDVRRGGELVFRMTGGISLSENPNVRFTVAAEPAGPIEVTVRDSAGNVFTGRSPENGS